MDRDKTIRDLRYLVSFGGASQQSMVLEIARESLELIREFEEQICKWLQTIADNQIAISGTDPLTEYEQGKWDGLQMAFDIMTGEQ